MGGMRRHGYTTEEVVRRGREIYEQEIRAEVEPGHDGDFVAVDIESGAWEVGRDDVTVSDGVLLTNPQTVLYMLRVGRPAAYRIGAGSSAP